MTRKLQKPNKQWLRYGAFFFAFAVLYNFIVINHFKLWQADNVTYTYHLVDYSFGFATKFLPGALYHLFFKVVLVGQLNVYLTVLTLLLFAFAAFMLAKLVCAQTDAAGRKVLLVLSLFFLSGPCTFSVFTYELGMLDEYWLFFSALFLVCLARKYIRFFIPFLFVASLLVHFSSVLSYIAFFAILLLYHIASAAKKSERVGLWIIFALSLAVTAVLGIYLITKEQSALKYSLEEFNQQLDARNRSFDETYYVYFDYSVYKHYEQGALSYAKVMSEPLLTQGGFFAQMVNTVYWQLKTISQFYAQIPGVRLQLLLLVLLCVPLYALFVKYWVKKIKVGTALQKFTYFLCIAQFPFTALIGTLFSPDVPRWMTHAFLIQFTLFLYIVYREKDGDKIGALLPSFVGSREVLLYYLIYAITFFDPYT